MNGEIKYITTKSIRRHFEVSPNTLRRWADSGKIRYVQPCIETEGSRSPNRLYCLEDIKAVFGMEASPSATIRICYARVSSAHQKEDLTRQIEFLNQRYPTAKIIQDVGSGLNWKRPGLQSLLELVHKGDVAEVVVAYRDRLCRFGIELIEWIFILRKTMSNSWFSTTQITIPKTRPTNLQKTFL